MLEKFRVKITILASLIVAAYAYFNHQSLLRTCYALIITIVVFYFLGGFIEIFLTKEIEHIEEEKKAEEELLEEEKEEEIEIEDAEAIEEEVEEDSNID